MTKKEQMEWVEIVEPRTKEHIYANLTTGECVWDPPPGVNVKKTDDNQWWELFDPNTSRFYYYNATSQKTVWHRPQNCDIIPLAKLQTLKQNTEVIENRDGTRANVRKESVSTQTAHHGLGTNNFVKIERPRMCTASTQTSPTSSPRDNCHHYHHHQSRHTANSPNVIHPNKETFGVNTSKNFSQLLNPNPSHESGSSPIDISSNSGYRKQDASWSSGSSGHSNSQKQDHYINHGSELAYENRPSTKSLDTGRRHRSLDHERGTVSTSWKHHSVDTQENLGKQSIIAPNSASKMLPHRKHHSEDLSSKPHFFSTFHPTENIDIDYLETPANRQQWSSCSRSTDSSMSSPQSPIYANRDVQVVRGADGSLFAFSDVPQESSDSSPQSMDSARGLDSSFISQGSLMSLDSQQKSVSEPATSPNLRNLHSKSKNATSSYEKDHGRHKSIHSREGSEVSLGSYYHSTSVGGSHKETPVSQQNEQPTPLYSNLDYPSLWDPRSDHHLLPLQQYLLEQAKLSGYRFGDFIGDDLDSLSQSDDDSDGQRDDDDDDDFADDEAMSHQDSSSQEYLEDSRYLDDEEDEVYCEPPLNFQENATQLSNTQHSSFRRKNTNIISSHSPVSIEKSQSFQPDMGPCPSPRPLSMIASTEGSVSTNNVTGSLQKQGSGMPVNNLYKEKKQPSESDIEKYAQDNLNRHKKGIFRKKFTIQDMLSWSKDPIRKPMIMITDKSLKREACEIFKMIQTYMGDRKVKSGQTVEAVILDIATKGWSRQAIRDEIFVQICRQTTDNPRRESLLLGWELMAICLTFFPPSVKFQPYLDGFVTRHKDISFDTPDFKLSHYAEVCSKRLERISKSGAKKGLRKPTLEEIDQSRVQIFRTSMFGNTLEEVMALQKNKYPNRSLPWIQTTLSELVLKLNGAQTEGIFRVPGDIDEVNAMKLQIDQWEVSECNDPHVPASLLKLWYRELYESLIPSEFYEESIQYCLDPVVAVNIVQKLPEINRLVLSYLIRFLQVFAAEQNAIVTKMDASNLAMVMAPNCLRCMSDDPRIIFENTRKEMAFVRMLIENLDTSYMEGIM